MMVLAKMLAEAVDHVVKMVFLYFVLCSLEVVLVAGDRNVVVQDLLSEKRSK